MCCACEAEPLALTVASILTTNRIKSFDEAFLSRISCGTWSRVSMVLIDAALRYPELERSSRKAIWVKVRSRVAEMRLLVVSFIYELACASPR